MKNLTIAFIGIALLWGFSGCADHQGYYNSYYTSGYPYSNLRVGATYSSYPGYPGYRPPIYRTWVGPATYYYPSGYNTWPAYYTPYPFYSLSLGYFDDDFDNNDHGRYYRGYYNKSGHYFPLYWPRKHPDKHHRLKGRHGHSKDHYVGGDNHKGYRDHTGQARIARHRQGSVLPKTGNPARLLPVVRKELSHGDHGVKIEYQRWSQKRTPRLDRRTDRLPEMNNPVTLPSSLSRSLDKRRQTTVRGGLRSTEHLHRIQREPRGERSVKRSRGPQHGKRPSGRWSFCMSGRC